MAHMICARTELDSQRAQSHLGTNQANEVSNDMGDTGNQKYSLRRKLHAYWRNDIDDAEAQHAWTTLQDRRGFGPIAK